MGLRELFFCRLIWVLALLICVSPTMVRPQINGCSINDINIDHCFNQVHNSMHSCCKSLHQALEIGFHCLCSLLTSFNPFLNTPLTLTISNCRISLPSLSLCPEPLPRNQTEAPEISAPKNVHAHEHTPSLPLTEIPKASNASRDINSTTVISRNPQFNGDAHKFNDAGADTSQSARGTNYCWFWLLLALYSCLNFG